MLPACIGQIPAASATMEPAQELSTPTLEPEATAREEPQPTALPQMAVTLNIPRPALPGLGAQALLKVPQIKCELSMPLPDTPLGPPSILQVAGASVGIPVGTVKDEADDEDEADGDEDEEEIDDDEDALSHSAAAGKADDSALGSFPVDIKVDPEALLVPAIDADPNSENFKPVADSKLELALDGQEPTTRNLIMAAIGVMKNRKARPDTKRICNWIHRRYGQPYMSIYEELERLVKMGELARVDYKGSASYRIVDQNAKATKKRKKTPRTPKKPPGHLLNGLIAGVVAPIPSSSCASAPSPSPSPLMSAPSTSSSPFHHPLQQHPTQHHNFLPRVNPGSLARLTQAPSSPVPSVGPRSSVACQLDLATSASLCGAPQTNSLALTRAAGDGITNVTTTTATTTNSGNIPCSINLRTLVLDVVGEDAKHSSSYQVNFPPKFIQTAVENTRRNINKGVVLGNLDMILKQEIEAGHFTQVAPDTYLLPPSVPQSIGTIHQFPLPTQPEQLDPALFPRKNPSPMPTVSLNEKTDEQRKNDLIQETLSKLTSGKDSSKGKSPGKRINPPKEPVYLTLREKRLASMAAKRNSKILASLMIPAPLPSPVVQPQSDPGPSMRGPKRGRMKKGDKRLQQAKLKNLDMVGDPSLDHPIKLSPKKKRNKRDSWKITMHPEGADAKDPHCLDPLGPNNPGRPGSMRKKKSRKIFDPADHDQPSRKRKALEAFQDTAIPIPMDEDLAASEQEVVGIPNGGAPEGSDISTPVEESVPEEPTCYYCHNTSSRNKRGRPETLLHCRDCTTIVHPSCMDYTDNLTRTILSTSWQCINCKTCSTCEDANGDDLMLFCDSCDLGYHMACHKPPVTSKPQGKWDCFKCQPPPKVEMPPPATGTLRLRRSQSTNSNSSEQDLAHLHGNGNGMANGFRRKAAKNGQEGAHNGSSSPLDGETTKFLPLLPAHLHPSKGLVPNNWEDFPIDPEIPDVGEWNCQKVEEFFVKLGFPSEQSTVFVREEIDGRSLLLLNRQDCLNGLGLKMGPALKLFHQIKILQTRRNFPN